MAHISINLLPIEFKLEQVKRSKFYKIQLIGVATIFLVIFLSSLTVALRILQSQNISRVQNQITQAESKLSGLKNTQASLLLLKNRLTAINQFLGVPSKQSQIYKLVTDLLPESVSVNSIGVDKDGNVVILAIAKDGNSLDNLINNLTIKEKNGDKISQVSLDGVNRGKDGIYRLSFKIKPK